MTDSTSSLAKVQPNTIATKDFSKEAETYTRLIERRKELNENMQEVRLQIAEVRAENDIDAETPIDQVAVYKDNWADFSEFEIQCAEESYHFNSIRNNELIWPKLKKMMGPELIEIFKKSGSEWSRSRHERDEKTSDKLRKTLRKLEVNYDRARAEYKAVEDQLSDMKELVSFYSDLKQLAHETR